MSSNDTQRGNSLAEKRRIQRRYKTVDDVFADIERMKALKKTQRKRAAKPRVAARKGRTAR